MMWGATSGSAAVDGDSTASETTTSMPATNSLVSPHRSRCRVVSEGQSSLEVPKNANM